MMPQVVEPEILDSRFPACCLEGLLNILVGETVLLAEDILAPETVSL